MWSRGTGTSTAVDDVSISVGHGEFFGILGPNGAGKTTLLEIIEGLREADSGTVQVLGEPAWPRNPKLLNRIGVQLQATSFFERLTAREQLATFAALYGTPPERVDEMFEMVALTDKAEHQGGEAVRRPGATAVHRLRADPRPGDRLPGRTVRGAGPAGPAEPVGCVAGHQRSRQDGGAHHALHGRGGIALRPGGDHGQRQDPAARAAGGTGPRTGCAHPDLGGGGGADASRRPRPSTGPTRSAPTRSPPSSPPAARRRCWPRWPSWTRSPGCRCAAATLEDVFLALTGREYRA